MDEKVTKGPIAPVSDCEGHFVSHIFYNPKEGLAKGTTGYNSQCFKSVYTVRPFPGGRSKDATKPALS